MKFINNTKGTVQVVLESQGNNVVRILPNCIIDLPEVQGLRLQLTPLHERQLLNDNLGIITEVYSKPENIKTGDDIQTLVELKQEIIPVIEEKIVEIKTEAEFNEYTTPVQPEVTEDIIHEITQGLIPVETKKSKKGKKNV